MSAERGALRPLTSLRFVAALLVFSWHCVPTRPLSATFLFGYIGVAFFFLLSGFILTYTYHGAFAERLRPEALRTFYVARLARVYPLHLATMPMMIAVLVYFGKNRLWSGVDPQTRLHAVVAQVLLVQSWSPVEAIHFGANGPAWSISVEAFFYALFPVAAFVLLRAFRASAPHVVLWWAFGLWLAEIVLLWPQHASIDEWRWYVFPPIRFVDFIVGMLLGIAFVRSDPARRWPLRGTSVEILALAAVALSILVSPLVPLSVRFAAWVMPAWCALILVFAWQRGGISRFFAHPVLVRLGEVSFAFYLCHLAVVAFFAFTIGWDHPYFMALAFATTLALSFVLYHGVEQPMRNRLRAALARRPARVRSAAARSFPALVSRER